MTVYAVHGMIRTHDGEYSGSVAVPTFYLDSRVQGITSREHARVVAAQVVNPVGLIDPADVDVRAYPVNPSRESAELDLCVADRAEAEAEWTSLLAQSDLGR